MTALLVAACGGGGGGGGDDDGPQAMVAGDDTVALSPGGSRDLLANDTLGGAAATAGTVGVTATGTVPAGVSVSAAGVLGIANGAAAGTYVFGYQVCELARASNCDTGAIALTVGAGGALDGRAVDASTGAGLPGVTVTAGGQTTTTDADGGFSLDGLPLTDRLPVNFDSPTHGESTRVTPVTPDGSTISVRLLPVGAVTTFDAATGGTAVVPGSSARLVVAGGTLQRADGTPASGPVSVQLTPIAPAQDISQMPGDFTTLVGGVPTLIESFGALIVEVFDAQGNALNLRPGSTASMRIALSTRNPAPPATVPFYWFDTTSGRWVEEGSGTLGSSAEGAYYEGSVAHFSTWNADRVYETVRVLGCVADVDGRRVAGTTISADGIDYSGASSATTDASGNFSLPIRRASRATAIGVSGSQTTNTVSVGPYGANTTLDDCLLLGRTGVTVKLTWGETPSDLDAHLFAPDGSHVYFRDEGDLFARPYAQLDVDDTTSYGPEVVTITRLMVGTYRYQVHNYSGFATGSIGASGARVELNLPGRAQSLHLPPASGESVGTDWWTLFELTVDAACNVTVTAVDRFAADEAPTPAAEAVYCAP